MHDSTSTHYTKPAENTNATTSVTQKAHQTTHQLVFLRFKLSQMANLCFEMII
ncbi:hypothetical protein [Terribacillus sp. DMT04]|uniref:hypothetical protein n=1 Tax=Terribacillus sp. DMT04 TaxID=2850441 RepID=UPI001C2C623F|nr:hypothetical protein [Terribacillus sp. DMT04]QXE01367.1 hypothetical protein KS242_15490 [Terribacillus sp. DMT04]